jgi:S1-C subfamily serine protease
MKRKYKSSRIKSYVMLAFLALMLGMMLGTINDLTPYTRAQETLPEDSVDPVGLIIPGKNIFADIASMVDAGVVLVTSEIEVQGSTDFFFPFDDPFFRFFFGDNFTIPNQQPRTQEGYGSGFIVTEDGYVVTNEHVIHNATKIEVTVTDQEEPLPAEVVWSDYDSDLAILKIKADRKFQPIRMGDSDKIRPGDWAIAIGNPFGFEHTVTVGVISALGRPITIPATSSGSRARTYANMILTDAAINPGNSGGPLLNIDGEVIGINTAVSLQGQGIGFAIPINEVKSIVKALQEDGEIIQPWLGIYYGEMTSRLKEEYKAYFNLSEINGVVIGRVIKDSPADKAGLRANDIITRIDGEEINKLDDVKRIISSKKIGDKIRIDIIRNGYSQMIFAEIGKRPNQL